MDNREARILNYKNRKDFDKLEWCFIKYTLHYFNIPSKVINHIMSCITSSKITILINGEKVDYFEPQRRIRQGESLSPYIFILCMEFCQGT